MTNKNLLIKEIKDYEFAYLLFIRLYESTQEDVYLECAEYMNRCKLRKECDLDYLNRKLNIRNE